ncbi:MAG TPA: ABC transporter substrate-binding protein [Rhizomicrobium sp.]|nr:ABC transporter substrate-binding protein [Rhizomicrobium sp.]
MQIFHTFSRRAALALALTIAPLTMGGLGAARAAGTPAEAFVQTNVQKGFDILNNKGLSQAQRDSQFRSFLESLTDSQRIANFTLGNAKRSASPADVAAFTNAFRDYAFAIYESRLSKYSGQTLTVTGSTERAPGDFVVTTKMVDPNASQRQPLEIDFRVSNTGGHFVVIDASVEGVWLAIEERDQFAAFMNDNGGNIQSLISHIQQLTQKIRAGGESGQQGN